MIMVVSRISATFGLEGSAHVHKFRSQAIEHLFDHVVRPNAKNLASKLSGHMPISQMPGKARKLIGILMPDLHDKLDSGLNP